jgi:hypothetical protein
MNKRSAITVALGLVAALVIGGIGLTMGMTGPAPSHASVRDPAPKVRTIHRTVTVHRPAAAPAATVLGTAPAAFMGAGTPGYEGGYEDEGYEDEGFEDEGFEDEGFEDEGFEDEGYDEGYGEGYGEDGGGSSHEGEDHGGEDD